MFDNKYLYSVTRTRVLETKLLDSTKVDRMVEAKNAEEVIKILGETEYANSISEMKHSLDYETIISKEIENTYKYLREILPEPELVDIFLLKYDIHNNEHKEEIKAWIRANPPGNMSKQEYLDKFIQSEKYNIWVNHFSKIMLKECGYTNGQNYTTGQSYWKK